MKLVMISAMYENGGNTFHRHLDGHSELWAYPFESQLGTRYVDDELLSMFPFKYRWPVFPLTGEVDSDFELFFDEEAKTRLRRPDGSKFRDADLDMKESERKELFIKYMKDKPRTPGNLVMAFYGATFTAWKNYNRSGKEKYFVGYSPIIGVDAEKIFADLPEATIIHIVRNPVACYSETNRRPFPLSLRRYVWTWEIMQRKSLVYQEKFKGKYIIIRYEDLIQKKKEVMADVCKNLGITFEDILLEPSWNGKPLKDQDPWGTIGTPDLNEQNERKSEISENEIAEIKQITGRTCVELGYEL